MARTSKKIAKKTAKKYGITNRKGRAKASVQLTFVNLERLQRGGDDIKIMKTGVYFGPSFIQTLGISKGQYLVFANDQNGEPWVGKKPRGVFGGTKVTGNKSSARLYCNLQAQKLKLKMGTYELGDSEIQYLKNEKGAEVPIEMYRLVII